MTTVEVPRSLEGWRLEGMRLVGLRAVRAQRGKYIWILKEAESGGWYVTRLDGRIVSDGKVAALPSEVQDAVDRVVPPGKGASC